MAEKIEDENLTSNLSKAISEKTGLAVTVEELNATLPDEDEDDSDGNDSNTNGSDGNNSDTNSSDGNETFQLIFSEKRCKTDKFWTGNVQTVEECKARCQ